MKILNLKNQEKICLLFSGLQNPSFFFIKNEKFFKLIKFS